MNKKITIAFLMWTVLTFVGGLSTAEMIRVRSAKMQAKHEVGTCLSNGLYFERVVEIRKGSVISEAKYILSPTIQGKLSAPGTTAAWIVDESYVVVNSRNCL